MTTLQRTATAAEIATPRRQLGTDFWKWMITTDHKVIGNLYFVTSMVFFLFGGVLALAMRAELAFPGLQFLSYEIYNQFFTMHGTIMLLLFATPLFAGFANAIMPLQIGSPDVAFPRLNMLAYWLYLFGGSDRLSRLPVAVGRGKLRLVRLRAAEQRGQLARRRRRPVDHGPLHGRPWHHPRRGQLRHHDPDHAGARHDHVPDADLHLEHPGDLDPGADRLPDSGRRAAGTRGRSGPRRPHLRRGQRRARSSGNTCSGSSAIPRSTSSPCRSSASSPRSCRSSAESRSSATSAWFGRRC